MISDTWEKQQKIVFKNAKKALSWSRSSPFSDLFPSRVHCFHYLIPLTKEGNYAIVANVESMDYDPLVVKLNKDISAIEEAMGAALQQHKFQYIFEGQCQPPLKMGPWKTAWFLSQSFKVKTPQEHVNSQCCPKTNIENQYLYIGRHYVINTKDVLLIKVH